jgi:hypothetical protein
LSTNLAKDNHDTGRSEDTLRKAVLLDCIGDGVVTIGPGHAHPLYNRAMRELLSYEQEVAAGKR